MQSSRGIMLIELMIGITISLLILSSLVGIYLATESSHDTQIALATLKDNTLMADKLLRSAIHQAGYLGCSRLTDQFPLVNHTSYSFLPVNKVISDANSVTIRALSLDSTLLTKEMHSDSHLYVSNQFNVAAGDVLSVSDCKTADLFIVKNVEMRDDGIQKITTSAPLENIYKKNSEIRRFQSDTYFVANTGRKNVSGEIIKSLYKKDIHEFRQEIIENINDMQVAIDTDRNKQPIGVSIQFTLFKKIGFIYAVVPN
jgi:Tfp pilus assembly protein PilW